MLHFELLRLLNKQFLASGTFWCHVQNGQKTFWKKEGLLTLILWNFFREFGDNKVQQRSPGSESQSAPNTRERPAVIDFVILSFDFEQKVNLSSNDQG